jgi:hypothetical protein
MSERDRIAQELLLIAARKSVTTQFGWVHPDCVTLKEAARMLRGEPEQKSDSNVIGVISDPRIGAN